MKDSYVKMTLEELVALRDELKKKQFELRKDAVLGHIANPLELRTIRRKIARLHTRIYQQILVSEENT